MNVFAKIIILKLTEFALTVISKITIIYILSMESALNAIFKTITKFQFIVNAIAKKILFIIQKLQFVNQLIILKTV